MDEVYEINYLDEDNYLKLEKSLKNYNLLAYNKLIQEYYPKIKNGEFVGFLVSSNPKEQIDNYELRIHTENPLSKEYVDIKLSYTVFLDQRIIRLNDLKPHEVLIEQQKQQ